MRPRLLPLICGGALLIAGVVSAGERASPPSQPKSGPGGADYRHDRVVKNCYGEGGTQYWLFEPASPKPKSAPLIVLNHGWGGMYPWPYGAWIEHLVRRGNIVIYPRYQASLATRAEQFTPNAIQAVKDAIGRLKTGNHVRPDLEKFAIVGHSAGGAVSANMAARARSQGLPKPRALMLDQSALGRGKTPSGFGAPGFPLADFSTIPADILMLVVVGSEDKISGDLAARIIFPKTPQIPQANKDWVILVSDYHGKPPLVADHFAPCAPDDSYAAGERGGWLAERVQEKARERFAERMGVAEMDKKMTVDALDYYGSWKLFDALTDAAFYGKNRGYALGNTPEQCYMGKWSDGTPVKELVVKAGS